MSATALKSVATGKDQAVAKAGPPKDFPAMLQAWLPEIKRALPAHMNGDRMARIALTAFRQTPKLADCDPKTVFAAVLQSAQMGLEIGLMGEAHLVPYGKVCQLIPGYQGLIKLAKQTGQIVDIYAVAVREKDKFRTTFGLNRTLEHDPLCKANGFPAPITERGEIIGHYAVAVFKDGSRTFVVKGIDEIHAIRDKSAGYQTAVKYKKDSPWTTHPEEMGNKTVIRALCKTLPKSPELAAALAMDDAHERGQSQGLTIEGVIEGSWTAPAGDEPEADEIIDQGTGEIKPAAAETAAPAQQPAQSQQPAAGPGIEDALAMVGRGAYGEARDLVKGKGFTDDDRAKVEAAITQRTEDLRKGATS